ncbi:MAG: isoprenylcysteine carboxylmethyltransferase family protein [Chloroflexi bacterium]|nr:MAG: isoprenylcysteine carboxylmethyltransferase family protein [Chloroflexota bacterium]
MIDPVENHLGQWGSVVLWIILGAIFLFFTPFYKKSQRKPSGVYLAFIVAMAFEMFGIPMSMYIIAWIFGSKLPDGILWGHTLVGYVGLSGMYIGSILMLIGVALVILGWNVIYKRYWSKESGKGELVTEGIYRFIRHPQYTGFMMITLGMLLDWATVPMLIMWPIMAVLYYRLAKKEEGDMLAEFGQKYAVYMQQTGRFLPRLWGARPAKSVKAVS